jgi:hypothetical protein
MKLSSEAIMPERCFWEMTRCEQSVASCAAWRRHLSYRSVANWMFFEMTNGVSICVNPLRAFGGRSVAPVVAGPVPYATADVLFGQSP